MYLMPAHPLSIRAEAAVRQFGVNPSLTPANAASVWADDSGHPWRKIQNKFHWVEISGLDPHTCRTAVGLNSQVDSKDCTRAPWSPTRRAVVNLHHC